MAKADQTKIEQPAGNKAKENEPLIQAMPEKYRRTALNETPVKRTEPKEPAKPKPVPPPAAKAPEPSKPSQPSKPSKPSKKKGFPVKLVVIGIIVIALFVAAALIVLNTLQQPESVPEIEIPDDEPPVTDDITADDEDSDIEDEDEPEEIEDEDEQVSPFAEDLIPGTDSDSDGLTDVEETLYGTKANLPDSDEDGFLDGNEVFHRYNPNGTAPASLVESGLVRLFDEASFSYTLTYPSLWNVRAIGGPTEQVVFTAESGEIIQVLMNAKSTETSITDWFLAQDLQASVDDLLMVETKEGLSGIMSPDRLTAYLDDGDRVFIISYNVGNKTTVDYLQTFQMMLNSMVIR